MTLPLPAQTERAALMKRRALLTGLLGLPVLGGCATTNSGILDALGDIALGGAGGIGGSGIVSEAQAADGIREALAKGVGTAITTVSATNGYFGDNLIKVPLPSLLQDAQSVLSRFGAGGLFNDLKLQLNRGAEQAAGQATNIFVDTIKQVSITDAIAIVRGSSTAATTYLADRTTPQLTSLFTPIMNNALQNTGALGLMDQIVATSRNVPFAQQLGADSRQSLISHGVDFGLSGLFHYIGQQEAAIRENPLERTSDLLRIVFG